MAGDPMAGDPTAEEPMAGREDTLAGDSDGVNTAGDPTEVDVAGGDSTREIIG